MKKQDMAEIHFWQIEEKKEYRELVQQVIGQAFLKEGLDHSNLYVNIILTTPENIKAINQKYRQVDQETDVLSFPMFEKEDIEKLLSKGNEIEEVLGDIIISIEQVKKQAKEYGHSFEREFSYMVVHGFYHLMGYDHIEEKDKIIMRKKEEEILKKLNRTRE